MKKRTMTLLVGMLLTIAVSCSDPYEEITNDEVIELPMTDDDDGHVVKPGNYSLSGYDIFKSVNKIKDHSSTIPKNVGIYGSLYRI